MSRADGLAAEAGMAEDQHATPSKDAQKAMAYLPSFVRRVSAHQFLLAELPPDLRDALADYDVDGDGALRCDSSLGCCWTALAANSSVPFAFGALAVAHRCTRRHGHGGRDRGGRSPPAPSEEEGTCRGTAPPRQQELSPAYVP